MPVSWQFTICILYVRWVCVANTNKHVRLSVVIWRLIFSSSALFNASDWQRLFSVVVCAVVLPTTLSSERNSQNFPPRNRRSARQSQRSYNLRTNHSSLFLHSRLIESFFIFSFTLFFIHFLLGKQMRTHIVSTYVLALNRADCC